MKKIEHIVNYILPFNSTVKNVLFYLSLSPLINLILTNIYYYNCGGYYEGISDIISIMNPFKSNSYLCYMVATVITMNLYVKSYIFYITDLYSFLTSRIN